MYNSYNAAEPLFSVSAVIGSKRTDIFETLATENGDGKECALDRGDRGDFAHYGLLRQSRCAQWKR